MKNSRTALCFALGSALVLPLSAAMTPEQVKSLPPPSERPVVFAQDIKPIFEASCIKCHARGRAKGGLALDTRETLLKGGDSGLAIVPGKSGESLLIELVAGVDPDNVMPKKGTKLTAAQIGLLRAWIDQGTPWDPKITFAKPAPLNLTPPAPVVKVDEKSSVNPIDQILKPYYKANGIKVAKVVDDRVFARRVWLDTIGLLPEPAELEAFCADKSRDKRTKLVERLLADSPRYTANWLSFWNDLLRNDYKGTGYIDGGRKQITKWLVSALSTNMPYDQFVAQLISPDAECEGFTKGIVWRGVVNASQTPPLQAAQNISQVFMGVNLKCASCHDSFINDWRLSDSYGLASIYSDAPLEQFQCDKPTGVTASARFIYPELGDLDPKADKPARLKRLAEIVTGPKDGRLSRTVVNRFWAKFFGRGLVEPVDDMEQPAWNQALLDWLAADLVANHYDLKHTMARIMTSQAYQLPAVNFGESAAKEYVFQGPGIRRLSAEQFRDAVGQLTGVWYHKAAYEAVTNNVRACYVAADPLAVALGRPNREQVTTTRPSAATTLQGLEMTNGKTLADVMQKGADKLTAKYKTPDALVQRVYAEALGRNPSKTEKQLAVALLGQPVAKDGVADLLWSVSMLPEFQLIY